MCIRDSRECVHRDAAVRDLATGAEVDRDARRAAERGGGTPAEAAKRVFLECPGGSTTYCFDLYRAGAAPGWGSGAMAVLYKCRRHPHLPDGVAADDEGLADRRDVTEAEVWGSKAFAFVLNAAVRPGGLTGARIDKHLFDYDKIETWG